MTTTPNTALVTTPMVLPSPNNFPAYTRAVATIPTMTVQEEQHLVQQWQNHKDADAARQLVLGHLYLVVKLVRSHAGYGLPEGDLAQEGTVGLMKAVHKFDGSKNVRLATYAWYWIEAEIREFILKNWRLVSWGTSSLAKKLFFGYRKTVSSLKGFGEERSIPSNTEIASALDVSESDAEMARSYFLGADIEIFSEDDDEDTPRSRVTLSTDNTPDRAIEADQQQQQYQAVLTLMPSLTEKQQAVLKGRFLTSPPLTLAVLSEKIGVSIERVRQIESEALKSLRKKMQPALEN